MSSTEDTIDAALAAHVAPGTIVTSWMAIAATVRTDGTDEYSGITLVYPGGGTMPWSHVLGLIEAARIRARRHFDGDSA